MATFLNNSLALTPISWSNKRRYYGDVNQLVTTYLDADKPKPDTDLLCKGKEGEHEQMTAVDCRCEASISNCSLAIMKKKMI